MLRPDDDGDVQDCRRPDGNYTVTVWHEGEKAQSKPITVAKGAKADFTLGK